MTRLALVSDTHGINIDKVSEEIKVRDLDGLVFLGDVYKDGQDLKSKTGLDLIQVLGNNDFYVDGKAPWDYSFNLDGYRIFASHGHKYGVSRGLGKIQEKAEEEGADIVLFGHTHVYTDTRINEVAYINPGSPSLARGLPYERTFAILDLSKSINLEKIIIK